MHIHLKYIDELKGFAALSVVLLHTLPREALYTTGAYFHIWQAVPVFVFISFFLLLRKLDKCESIRKYYCGYKNVVFKVIVPFIVVQSMLIGTLLVQNNGDEIVRLLKVGGLGPGAYYPYLYVQIWLIVPFLYYILRHRGGWLFVVILGVALNLLADRIPYDRVYSSSVFRYLFLSVLAYWWKEKKVKLTWLIPASIISIIYLSTLNTVDYSLLVGQRWQSQQLPAFFYTLLFVYVFWYFNKFFSRKLFSFFGKYSYEIFMSQMFFVAVLPKELFMVQESSLNYIMYVVVLLILSVFPAFIVHEIKRIKNEKYSDNPSEGR